MGCFFTFIPSPSFIMKRKVKAVAYPQNFREALEFCSSGNCVANVVAKSHNDGIHERWAGHHYCGFHWQSSCSSHNGDLVGETNSSFPPPGTCPAPPPATAHRFSSKFQQTLNLLDIWRVRNSFLPESYSSSVADHEEEEDVGWSSKFKMFERRLMIKRAW